MSIFRSSFTKEVQEQLTVRQNAISNRTPQSIQYMGSRNAWIRMTSSVNVDNDNGDLARKNVLLGGVLNTNNKLRSGVGSSGEAYSTTSPGGKAHLRGIRPMPGITSIDIKSKSAYGSLREVTVNFICWDITQLEDLEVLYMRPGYTVLVEWGWIPYLDNNNILQVNTPQFYDILGKGPTERTTIFKELFAKSKASGGNYDAMFGYIKNYQWSARADGGYDCQAVVISTGEIIESLKLNFLKPNLKESQTGMLKGEISTGAQTHNSDFNKYYSKNILAGLWYETYKLIGNSSIKLKPNSVLKTTKFSSLILPITATQNTNETEDTLSSDGRQRYITLETVFDLINKYVIIEGNNSEDKLLKLSLNSSEITSDNSPLLCVAHPLQISTDPTVCLINSPLWVNGEIITPTEKAANNVAYQTNVAVAQSIYDDLVKGELSITGKFFGKNAGFKEFKSAFNKITTPIIYSLVNGLLERNNKGNLETFLKKNLFANEDSLIFLEEISPSFNKISGDIKIEYKTSEESITEGAAARTRVRRILTANSLKITGPASQNFNAADTISTNAKQALANLDILKNLKSSYFNGDPYNEIGIIKNIYINLDFLYKLSLSANLESQDRNGKNEINVYNYIKNIISAVQTSLGNVNNFEIHVDPVDNNIARIIDINYTGAKNIYDSLFPLQVHNLKSVVRSYNLQSQIFPEQSAIIAIGSQAKGGQLGIQNNTMIDFNRSLIDRITPKKGLSGNNSLSEDARQGNEQLSNGLASLVKLFASFGKNLSVDKNPENKASVLFNDGKNALRDLITYFQSITSSPGKNRNLIPIKFSVEMDGIGGLVIGHMFKLPNFILPRGYRGDKIGVQLGQTITSISHTIQNNDWVTKIDALNIVLSDQAAVPFKDLDFNKAVRQSLSGEIPELPPPGREFPNAKNLEKYLKDNNIAAVKSGELSNGGEIEQGIAAIAGSVLGTIKNKYPDINLTVTAGNDTFHQNQAGFSNHQVGKAIDFAISPATQDNINKVESVLAEFSSMQPEFRYLNEYNNPSANATGKHFHISFGVATKGA